MRRLYGKSRRTLVPAGILIAAGVGLLLWGVFNQPRLVGIFASLRHSEFRLPPSAFNLSPVSTAAFAQPKNWPCPIPGDFKPVDIPVGLLCDYYEHGIEHAPPRDPSGVMQKRERFYAAPCDPFELISVAATDSRDDQALVAEVTAFRANWQAGAVPSKAQLTPIETRAAESSLTCGVLIEAGRAMNWLAGDHVAGVFFRSGLVKAGVEYAGAPPGSASSLAFIRATDQTKCLWRIKDWQTLERRFRLSRALSAPLSAESRRSGHLAAEMLYYQNRCQEAADLIETVCREHESVGDLGVLDRSDVDEVTWVRGLFIFESGHPGEALKYFGECARLGGAHAQQASLNLFRAYLAMDRVEDAARQMDSHIVAYRPPPGVVQRMHALLQAQRVSLPPIPDFSDGGTNHD